MKNMNRAYAVSFFLSLLIGFAGLTGCEFFPVESSSSSVSSIPMPEALVLRGRWLVATNILTSGTSVSTNTAQTDSEGAQSFVFEGYTIRMEMFSTASNARLPQEYLFSMLKMTPELFCTFYWNSGTNYFDMDKTCYTNISGDTTNGVIVNSSCHGHAALEEENGVVVVKWIYQEMTYIQSTMTNGAVRDVYTNQNIILNEDTNNLVTILVPMD